MTPYQYVAVNQQKMKISGNRAALNTEALIKALTEEGLTPLEIKTAAAPRSQRVTTKAIETFSVQWARQLRHKVKADKALEIISAGSRGLAAGQVAESLLIELRNGASIAQALKKHEEWFDEGYRHLCAAGEASGQLPRALTSITEQQAFSRSIRNKLRQATVYPFVISLVCVAAIIFVLVGIVPRMSGLFDDAVQLPLYTQLLLSTSDWLVQNLGNAGLVCLVISVGMLSPDVRKKTAGGLLVFASQLPGLRYLVLARARLEFLSGMATLLASKVSLVQCISLSIAEGSQLYSHRHNLVSAISSGQSVTAALRKAGFLSPEDLAVLEAAEPTAALAEAFAALTEEGKVAFEEKVERLITLVEPILIVVMGAIVGSIIVVMMMSILSAQEMGI